MVHSLLQGCRVKECDNCRANIERRSISFRWRASQQAHTHTHARAQTRTRHSPFRQASTLRELSAPGVVLKPAFRVGKNTQVSLLLCFFLLVTFPVCTVSRKWREVKTAAPNCRLPKMELGYPLMATVSMITNPDLRFNYGFQRERVVFVLSCQSIAMQWESFSGVQNRFPYPRSHLY